MPKPLNPQESMDNSMDTPSSTEAQENAAHGNMDIKVIVMNYGKWKDAKALEDVLRKEGVSFVKVQKARHLSFGFVHFHSTQERLEMLPKLQVIQWQGEFLEVKEALPKKSMQPIHRPPSPPPDDKSTLKTPLNATLSRNVCDVVTPWASIPYEHQLQLKETAMKKVLIKIVRHTRKEFHKKQKRVVQDHQNIARKKRKLHAKKTLENNATMPLETSMNTTQSQLESTVTIPSWLASPGALYLVANNVLYSRLHERETPWTRVSDALNIIAITSWNSNLIAIKSTNELVALKQDTLQQFKWESIGHGPLDCLPFSIVSIQGILVLCTTTGHLFKHTLSLSFDSNEWKSIGNVSQGARLGVHHRFLYACTNHNWQRASIQETQLDSLVFEPVQVPVLQPVLGISSHNNTLLLLTPTTLEYVTQDKEPSITSIPLQLPNMETLILSGLTSHTNLCCTMDSIHASPVIQGYRNKCDFSFGYDEWNQPCLGFRMGLFRHGSVLVSQPYDCIHVSIEMKAVCLEMQALVDSTKIPVYNVESKTGVWRVLTVRQSTKTRELMLLIQVNFTGYTDNERASMKTQVRECFTNSKTASFQVTSIYIQEYHGHSTPSDDDPIEHVYGKFKLEEELLHKRFVISPTAFFQVNTRGAETLYTLIQHHAQLNPHTMLYDVCCGTGTIGICASKGAGQVVGIELCHAATIDAEENARRNDVNNIRFINSKAESVMKELLHTKRDDNNMHLQRVVAIVDPPRAGLHHHVLRALRACPPVERIVYVSCNPTISLVRDAVTLCGPSSKSLQGRPFQPVHAVPVDMFPHTPHCELILVFDRVKND
ncbi:hypothetical protein CCR75_000892 [Bremia lactucae]|uniref:tRNA (Uracil-5-)-methyltransferase n=1 Tax=Bremia lactucae TaxID=4779 RepID=A0A976FP65_BRELC|nr:hypothetical protein CCR75_000892 [Bremia lactucae]